MQTWLHASCCMNEQKSRLLLTLHHYKPVLHRGQQYRMNLLIAIGWDFNHVVTQSCHSVRRWERYFDFVGIPRFTCLNGYLRADRTI